MRLTLFLCCSFAAAWAGDVKAVDGFESPKLSNVWSSMMLSSGAIDIQSDIVRAGKSALRITLTRGDNFDDGGGIHNPNERDELMEAIALWSLPDTTYSYSFSMLIPADFPIVPDRLVIAQWKHLCGKKSCDPDNPIIAFRFEKGVFRVTLQTSRRMTTLYQTSDDIRNRWLDFRFQVRFSRQTTGLVKGWLNDKQIVDYQGVTAYPESGGYPREMRFYFKMGLYRDAMKEPMTIYLDEYRKEQLP